LSVFNQEIFAIWEALLVDVDVTKLRRVSDRKQSTVVNLNRFKKAALYPGPRIHKARVRLLPIVSKGITHDGIVPSSLPFPAGIVQVGNTPRMDKFVSHHSNVGGCGTADSFQGTSNHVCGKLVTLA
jgi:hypothetical protein